LEPPLALAAGPSPINGGGSSRPESDTVGRPSSSLGNLAAAEPAPLAPPRPRVQSLRAITEGPESAEAGNPKRVAFIAFAVTVVLLVLGLVLFAKLGHAAP
jgi:hypothetical protein